ncbi:hypothetical protein PAXINDRAFT_64540, partial [Paxillus involutus ATCC 200175]
SVAPFGVAHDKIGTIQRRLAWPLHKDDTLFRSGRPTGLNIYFACLSISHVIVLPGEYIRVHKQARLNFSALIIYR